MKTLESIIRRNDAKALFLDEWNLSTNEKKGTLEGTLASVDVVWIANDAEKYYFRGQTELQVHINGFTYVDLKLNFRNSREIFDASNEILQKEQAFMSPIHPEIYIELASLPINFPCGRPITLKHSLAEHPAEF